MSRKTKDPVNQPNIDFFLQRGEISLGLLKGREWIEDPRRLIFSLARYKFVSKMLSGRTDVLEVGSGDGFCAPVVMQEVGSLTLSDYCEEFVADARKRVTPEWSYQTLVHNYLDGSIKDRVFDAIYSLDVFEHIHKDNENDFISNMMKNLSNHGVMIIGMPSLESQKYASPGSKLGHINCKSGPELKDLMGQYFNSVFLFSMNDEVVHTGFHKMAHYILAVCAHKR